MKKYLLLLAVTGCFFAGCKLDESGFPKSTDGNLLIGKWYNKTTTTYVPPQNNVLLSVTVDNNFTTSDYMLFDANNATKSMTGLAPVTYKYVRSGSTLTFTSLTDATDTDTQTIQKLTADSLVLVSTVTVTAGTTVNTATITERFARK